MNNWENPKCNIYTKKNRRNTGKINVKSEKPEKI